MKLKLVKKIICLYENEKEQELIHVWGEDTEGYIIFERCDDPTRQLQKMTRRELMQYKPIWDSQLKE